MRAVLMSQRRFDRQRMMTLWIWRRNARAKVKRPTLLSSEGWQRWMKRGAGRLAEELIGVVKQLDEGIDALVLDWAQVFQWMVGTL